MDYHRMSVGPIYSTGDTLLETTIFVENDYTIILQ